MPRVTIQDFMEAQSDAVITIEEWLELISIRSLYPPADEMALELVEWARTFAYFTQGLATRAESSMGLQPAVYQLHIKCAEVVRAMTSAARVLQDDDLDFDNVGEALLTDILMLLQSFAIDDEMASFILVV